jgi:pimeloyl-ACP methyl ester carboxylesterase
MATTGYVRANGLNMYYEIHGDGEPLVLLHGSFMTIDLNYGQILPELAKDRRVVAVEQQAHGHTEDIDRRFSYEQMADDTAELLRQLKIGPADILGYSMGGTIAIEFGLRYPELVRKLVVISAPYDRAGWYPEVYDTINQITPEMFDALPLPSTYAAVAPNPAAWPTLWKCSSCAAVAYSATSPDCRTPSSRSFQAARTSASLMKPHLLLPMITEFLAAPTKG